MFSRNVSLSDLLFMTDEDLEERNRALQDFKNDMFITDLEQSVPRNRNVHVNIQLTDQNTLTNMRCKKMNARTATM